MPRRINQEGGNQVSANNIGALWQKTSKKGNSYLGGKIMDINVKVFMQDDGSYQICESHDEGFEQVGYLEALHTKDGDLYFSGKLTGNPIVVFKNKYKTEDKHPHWKVFEGKPQRSNSGNRPAWEEPADSPASDEDIPF